MLKNILKNLKEREDFSILLVEDELMVLKPMQSIMQHLCANVLIAHDGVQGWDLYQKNSFTVVVTDLQMPNMNGAELIKHIRSVNSEQIIIVITAFREGIEVDQAKSLGANFILEKPFSLATFLNALETLNIR